MKPAALLALFPAPIVVFLATSVFGSTQAYTIADLGTLGGSQSVANGINNLGQVVGSANLNSTSPITNHAFLYASGVMTDLGVLGVYSSSLGIVDSSSANGINNRGQVVGFSYTSGGAIDAFLYDQGQMTDLGVLPGSQQSKARAINDNGQIVGGSLPAGVQHAFLYDGGTMNDLGTLGGTESFAYGINNQGQIVGDSWVTNGGLSDTAFVYSNGTMTALGNLGGWRAIQVLAINDHGQIVGYAGDVNTGGPSVTRGFLYSGGTMTDLGDLGGLLTNVTPAAINNQGQVVGTVSGYTGPVRAFLYSGGAIKDLNTLIDPSAGWTLFHANGINDRGQIVGSGQNKSFQTHAFLLTPAIVLQIFLTSSNAVQIQFTAQANTGYVVEYSDSLGSCVWHLLDLLDPAPFSQPVVLTDPLSPGRSARFYRARTR
jgi:probable HAF family extracellular repeat protein